MNDAAYQKRWLAKFWKRVDQSGGPEACWPWLGSTNPDGYGVVYYRERDNNELVHRKAWEIAHGPIPPDVKVLHTCDNPPCCNQLHLFTGTHMDNVQDKMAKGRWRGSPKKRVLVNCKQCGVEKEITLGRVKRFKFCSGSCRTKYNNPVLARWKI